MCAGLSLNIKQYRNKVTPFTELAECNAKDEQLILLKKYPLFIPMNSSFTSYDGLMKVEERVFHISLDVPHYPDISDMKLKCDWELQELLSQSSADLHKWTESANKTLLQFMEYFHCLVEKSLGIKTGSWIRQDDCVVRDEIDNLNRYSSVLLELQSLGPERLAFLSSDLSVVTLTYHGNADNKHQLTLKLSPQYPESVPGNHTLEVMDTDLPEPIIKLIQKESTLTSAYDTFCKCLSSLSSIWHALTLIDMHCWVIDPTHPKKADMYRRIFLDPPRVMAQIMWNPLQPTEPPDMKFQGAETVVDVFRSTYEENLENWSPDSNVVENLCSVLSISELPSPPKIESIVQQNVDTGECCICYAANLNGKLPNESCGKCLSSFHAACLYEWLETLPNSRQVHGHISGPCPNCETPVICPCSD